MWFGRASTPSRLGWYTAGMLLYLDARVSGISYWLISTQHSHFATAVIQKNLETFPLQGVIRFVRTDKLLNRAITSKKH